MMNDASFPPSPQSGLPEQPAVPANTRPVVNLLDLKMIVSTQAGTNKLWYKYTPNTGKWHRVDWYNEHTSEAVLNSWDGHVQWRVEVSE
jgi:hypothetical protein